MIMKLPVSQKTRARVVNTSAPKFQLGRLLVTPNAAMHVSNVDLLTALRRHVLGDCGDMCDEDKAANARAITGGSRILSAYTAADGTKFWVITEADRSVTTILLPEDY